MSHLDLESADPLEVFSTWYADAVALGAPSSDAMILATVDETGRPSARTVLYKGLYEGKVGFVSNYESRKAGISLEIHEPRSSSSGRARCARCASKARSRRLRPTSQIAISPLAIATARSARGPSQQSRPIGSRQELIDAVEASSSPFRGSSDRAPAVLGHVLVRPRGDRALGFG